MTPHAEILKVIVTIVTMSTSSSKVRLQDKYLFHIVFIKNFRPVYVRYFCNGDDSLLRLPRTASRKVVFR